MINWLSLIFTLQLRKAPFRILSGPGVMNNGINSHGHLWAAMPVPLLQMDATRKMAACMKPSLSLLIRAEVIQSRSIWLAISLKNKRVLQNCPGKAFSVSCNLAESAVMVGGGLEESARKLNAE